jgi:hypothetical protein
MFDFFKRSKRKPGPSGQQAGQEAQRLANAGVDPRTARIIAHRARQHGKTNEAAELLENSVEDPEGNPLDLQKLKRGWPQ